MEKLNKKNHLKFIYILLLLLTITFLPLNINKTYSAGEYLISDEQTLKDWLLDTNSIQTNNPSAKLTQNITLNWGNVASHPSKIRQNSILNGNNFTIYLQGFNGTTQSGTYYEISLFADIIYGT